MDPAACAAPASSFSHLTSMRVHAVREVLESHFALLQPLLRGLLRVRPEHVPAPQVPKPAAQPLEILVFLVQLGGGELPRPDLLVDLPVELAALGQELLPLVLAVRVERLLEPGGGR